MEMFGTNVRRRADRRAVRPARIRIHRRRAERGGLPAGKGLAKRALAFEKILYPDFAVFSRDDLETGGNLRMPLFVKPLRADASIGIGTTPWSATRPR